LETTREIDGYAIPDLCGCRYSSLIQHIVETPEIDFANYNNNQPKTTSEMVEHFDMNLKDAKRALEHTTDESLSETFSLKNKGQV